MALFWDEANWQPLCKPCHDQKTAREDGPAQVRPKWLKTPGCTVRLVCGPPGSGKTTLVRDRVAENDIVIDLDEIVAELSGAPLYKSGGAWLGRGIRERNRRLASLHHEPKHRVAWVITTGYADTRRWWIDKLKPIETIVLRTPEHVCAHRITGDPRRAGVAAAQCRAVASWWSIERAHAVQHGATDGEGGSVSLGGVTGTDVGTQLFA